jgi:hypothetical protein
MGIQDADLVCDESPNMQFPKECDNGLPSLPDCLGSGATVDGLGELGVTVEAWVTPPDALGTAYCMEIISPFNVAVPVAVASETLTHSL